MRDLREKRAYRSLDELQVDLDAWVREYNEQRTHSGKYCYGKTPLQTFLDSRQLAQDKMIDRLTASAATDNVAQRAQPEPERSPAQRSGGGGGARGAAA